MTNRVSWLHLQLVMLLSPALSFSTFQHPSSTLQSYQPPKVQPRTGQKVPSKTQLDALVEIDSATSGLDDFFRTQPFLSAFVACSVKASVADFLAQTSVVTSKNAAEVQRMLSHSRHQVDDAIMTHMVGNINIQRNIAFLLYGGLYQGMFLQFLYLVVYPNLYSGSAFRIPLSIFSDIFAFGPLVTLPIAYIIQSIMANITVTSYDDKGLDDDFLVERVHQALEKYKNHVLTKDLLTKYWMVWGPAQTINWCFVPEHLRVFFVAFVSFFWVYLLSAISSQQSETLPHGSFKNYNSSEYDQSPTMRI